MPPTSCPSAVSSAAERPTVLIGPVSSDPTESVSSVNRAFISGLSERFEFATPNSERSCGSTRQAKLNAWNLWYLLKHAAAWVWALVRHRPDIAHYAVSSGWALEKGLVFLGLARAFGAGTVGHLHSGSFIDEWKRLPVWRHRWAARQLRSLDAIVCLSETWRRKVIDELGILPDRVFVVNNPIDPTFEAAALEMPVERPGNHILSLGVMGRDKGVLDLVAATAIVARNCRNFKLDIAGPEREPGIRALVESRLTESGIANCVTLDPAVWGTAKIDMFRKASISILPSYYENFPLVVLEAAAAGHAIITTPVGAVPEFFEDGVSALYVEAGNVDQIAVAIHRLIENPTEKLRLGRAARAVFLEKLSRTQILQNTDSVYRQVLTKELMDQVDHGLNQSVNA